MTTTVSDAQKHAKLESLLAQFSASEAPLSSRVDGTIAQTAVKPLGILQSWKYLPFVVGQASSAAAAFVSHHVYGPAKPSWGIEMTLFTTFLRNSVEYSHLSNIEFLRRVLDLGQILPTPKDGVVTPVSFRVRKRGLRGFLKDADEAENGNRELTAEWVFNKRLWRRMQSDYRSSSSPGQQASFDSPRSTASSSSRGTSPHSSRERVIYWLHGGAYYVFSAASHRFLTIQVSKYTDTRVFALNYRLAPETRFPGALLDAVNGYFRLIYDLKIPPENIILGGDSAGGGLSTALLLYLRDEGYPLPAGAVLMSPWVDLTMSCASWDTNAKFDYLPQPPNDDQFHPVKCYIAPETLAEHIVHPYASPLFGNFKGLPPLLIQCGDAERLRDEGTLLAHKASLAGVQVEHEVYEDCVHVFQMFGFLDATRKALRSVRHFVRDTLAHRHTMDSSQMDSELMADAHNVRDEDAGLEPESLAASPTSNTTSMPDQHSTALPATTDLNEAVDQTAQFIALTATRKILQAASGLSSTTSNSPNTPTSPSSSSRRLRRLPSASSVFPVASTSQLPEGKALSTSTPIDDLKENDLSTRPRRHKRSQTIAILPSALKVRARSGSHPDVRALMEDYSKSSFSPSFNVRYTEDDEGDSTDGPATPVKRTFS